MPVQARTDLNISLVNSSGNIISNNRCHNDTTSIVESGNSNVNNFIGNIVNGALTIIGAQSGDTGNILN
jgi:hypothetical protein